MAAKRKKPKEDPQQKLTEMMAAARSARSDNRHLIQAVREDAALANRVRELLCSDLRRVYNIPREILGPSASARRYREHGHYSEQLVYYLIGDWPTFKRLAKIEESLGVRKVKRNIGKISEAQAVMRYADENVKPWDGAYSRLDVSKGSLLLQVGSDFHSKFIDPFARRVWMDVAKKHQPDGVRYNGDLADFPKLSRHRQLPGHFALSLQEEIDICTDFVRETREAAPESDQKFIIGNHDARLIYALADSAPIYCDLRTINFHELFCLDELELGLVCRPNFLNPTARMRKKDIAENWETIADLFTIVHGWLLGKDAPRSHMARFMRYGTNGHLHDPCMVSGGSDATGTHQWWQTPCMAYPPAVGAEYMPGPIEHSGWTSGFGMFRLFPKHGFVSGQIVVVGEVAEYGGDVWHITEDERDQRQALLEI